MTRILRCLKPLLLSLFYPFFHQQMALSRNLCGNPPEADKSSELLLRHTTEYASAQFLDFLDLSKNSSFPDWNHI